MRTPMRTRFGPPALAGALLWILALPLWAQRGEAGGAGPVLRLDPDLIRRQAATSLQETVDVNNQTSLMGYIQTFLATHGSEDQDQIVSEITDYCLEHGLRPSPDVAETFLALALEAKSRGDLAEYRRLGRFAASFHPDHPAVHLALADGARAQEGFFSMDFLFESLFAAASAFRNPETRPVALANLAVWLRITALLLLSVMVLVQVFQYQALLRHDVKEWLGGGDSRWLEAAGLVALFLPSLLLLSGYWWIVYWAALFLFYGKWSERVATLLAVAAVVASGAFAVQTRQSLYLEQAPPHLSNVRCHANRVETGMDGYLGEHIGPMDPERGTYGYLLACRYMLHGSYDKAENLFRSLLTDSPSDAGIYNNLGCLYFYQNRFQEAIQQFSKAVEARPDFAPAFLNRAMAKNKVFDFSGSEEDQAQARRLDPSIFRVHGLHQNEEWTPVPAWLPPRTTLNLAVAKSLSAGSPPGGRPGRLLPLLLGPAFSLWLLVLPPLSLLFVLSRKKDFFARACFKCGQPFCNRCKTSLEFESFCSQCVHLYIKQDGVSPEARMKKNYEVESHQRLRRTVRVILALAAPGTSHLLDGRPFSALFLLALWLGVLAALFSGPFLFPLTFSVPLSTAPLRTLVLLFAATLILILWGLFGVPSALRPPPLSTGRPPVRG